MEMMNKLYKENGMYFMMAITYLLQIGFDGARKITDDMITSVVEKTSPNAIISGEMNRYLMETARQIANEMTEVKLMQWLQVNKPYDTKGIKKAQ